MSKGAEENRIVTWVPTHLRRIRNTPQGYERWGRIGGRRGGIGGERTILKGFSEG